MARIMSAPSRRDGSAALVTLDRPETMEHPTIALAAAVALTAAVVAARATHPSPENGSPASTARAPWEIVVARSAQDMMDSGRTTFRFATFGD